MNSANEPAFPSQAASYDPDFGLTKREEIAKHLMASLLTRFGTDDTYETIAEHAVRATDALLRRLKASA